MPLLYKKPFTKKKIDPNLKPNSKVFFCDLTEEVFLDYDEFWERLVLLNALVWTCELTGHPNLTFQEALESENKARQSLSNVTLALKRPIMYIASYTRRGKINDMSDDVFNYIRDRYFLGEEVEAIVSKHWYDCKVTRIVMPTNEEVALYEKEIAESDEDSEDEVQVIKPVMNGSLVNKDDDDDDDEICVLRDDHLLKKTAASCPSKNDDDEFPPFPTVKYEVVEIEPWDYKECKKHVVSWDQIRRPKSAFTREKCKVFLKQCVRMNLEGYWALKDILFQKYVIQSMVYSDIFVGRPPKFAESRLKKVLLSIASEKNEMKHKNKETKDKLKESKNNKVKNGKLKEPKCLPTPPKGKSGETKKSPQKPEPIKEIPKIVLSEEDMEALRQRELIVREKLREKHREEIRLRLERMRAAKKRERDLEKEEKRLMGIFKQFLNRKREDLECDDHLDLPMTTPIQCRIPNELFGDFIVILEFVNAFSDRLELKDVYSQGITFDMLEHSLIEKEIAGVFNDIVQLLLGAIFCLQEEEDEEVEEDTTVDMAAMEFESNLQSIGLKSAISLANKAATWSQQYQGVPLQKAPLDALTLTEVLRLHFLASGASNVANAFWRHVNRGGYKPTDDPGLYFKLDEPDIIKKLTTEPVFDLQIGEKIKVLNVLMSQILTYASVRDALDEKYEKLRETNNNLRLYRFAEIRKEKEELLAKKQKTRDEKLKLMKKKIDQMNKSDKNEQAKENEEPEKEPEEEDEEEKRVREEKEEKQRERRKQEAMKKEKEFIEKMHSLSKEFRLFPLGQDRAYRKYWLFSSLNGLFVEDWDPCIGTCLESPTPVMESTYIPEEDKGLVRRIQIVALKNLEAVEKRTVPEKTNSDKENGSPKANAKKPLPTPTLNGNDGDVICCNGVQNYNEKLEEDLFFIPTRTYDKETLKKNHSRIFGLCSADKDCPVHVNAKARQRWSFIHSKEVLQFLISSLNSRGNRESELKDSLLLNREKIELSLQNCLAFKLDPSQEPQVQTVPQRKSERNIPSSTSASSNLNFPPGTTMDRILELTLRDMILELEEKLHHGMLGSLKVQERNTWRDALVNGTSISFSQLDLVWGGKKRINQFKSDLGIEVKEEEELIDSEDYVSKDGLTQAGVVKELAIAILQVAQALEPKYLKKPLAESDKMIKKRIKAENRLKNLFKKDKKEDAKEESSSDDEDESFEDKNPQTTVSDNALRTAIERWEKSLMACTSFSQLFLHLATLDNSITWSRSAVNTRCSICRKKSDPENTLLCDQCDRGYHMYCLKPPIKVVPTGDWFCDKCKPKEKPKSPRKQRKIYKEESDEEEDEEEIEEPQASFVNHEYCDLCETGGEIICCDTCPRSFHFECANLRKVPRGNWSCPMCRGQPVSKKKKLKSGKKAVESNKREAKKRTSRKPSDESYTVENDDTDEDSIVLRKRGVKRPIEEVDNDYYHKGAIETLLNELISHDDAWPFGKPVHRQGVPDYYEKIKKPMDLRTLKMRFNRNKYSTDAEFIADSLLIFQNCRQYFKEDDPEYQAGIRLSKYFLRKIKLYKLADGNEYDDSLRPSKRRR